MPSTEPTSEETESSADSVLHVVHGYYPESAGGTEAYVRSLLEAQSEMGLRPQLLHGSFEPRPETCIEARDDLDVPAWRLHRADSFSDYWDKSHYTPAGEVFDRFLDTHKPDVVHLHQWIRLTNDLVHRCARKRIPCVVSLHDLYSSCPACFRLRPDDAHCERRVSFENCADCVPLRGHEGAQEVRAGIDVYRRNSLRELRSASIVLAATRATAELVTSGLGMSDAEAAERITLLPLAYGRRFAGLEISRGDAAGELQLAYWGNVTSRKGVDVLLDALRILDARTPLQGRVRLDIFGKIDLEELRADLEARARGLPVHFRGRYEWEELATLGIDLAVFPSTCFETYGFVLDEAFELGVPALVTDVGAFAERIGDAGFAVPPADPNALAEQIAKLLADRSALEEARARIPAASPTPEQHAQKLLELYRAAQKRCAETTGPANEDPGLQQAAAELQALRERGPRDSAPARRGLEV